ncbi:MAG: hypothetical protein QOE77_745 [Blastocatellia bacterium]|jgi:methanogenic corrinoid protein MtbC1|nr:hypothetical protein [Blastocatellia bacterium]
MAEAKATKLRIKAGSFEVDFEGTEGFLRADVPKLIKSVNDLHSSEVSLAANLLKNDLEESISVKAELDQEVENIKSTIDSMSEMGEMESLRLQMAMDRMSKMMSTLSNLLKKMSDTAGAIVQNMK